VAVEKMAPTNGRLFGDKQLIAAGKMLGLYTRAFKPAIEPGDQNIEQIVI
jgi:hypothetical protein